MTLLLLEKRLKIQGLRSTVLQQLHVVSFQASCFQTSTNLTIDTPSPDCVVSSALSLFRPAVARVPAKKKKSIVKTQSFKSVSSKGLRRLCAPSDARVFVSRRSRIFVFMVFLLLEIKVRGLTQKVDSTSEIVLDFISLAS